MRPASLANRGRTRASSALRSASAADRTLLGSPAGRPRAARLSPRADRGPAGSSGRCRGRVGFLRSARAPVRCLGEVRRAGALPLGRAVRRCAPRAGAARRCGASAAPPARSVRRGRCPGRFRRRARAARPRAGPAGAATGRTPGVRGQALVPGAPGGDAGDLARAPLCEGTAARPRRRRRPPTPPSKNRQSTPKPRPRALRMSSEGCVTLPGEDVREVAVRQRAAALLHEVGEGPARDLLAGEGLLDHVRDLLLQGAQLRCRLLCAVVHHVPTVSGLAQTIYGTVNSKKARTGGHEGSPLSVAAVNRCSPFATGDTRRATPCSRHFGGAMGQRGGKRVPRKGTIDSRGGGQPRGAGERRAMSASRSHSHSRYVADRGSPPAWSRRCS